MVPFARAEHPSPDRPRTERPLRVLMAGLEWFSDNPGGGGRYLTEVAKGLASRGHVSTVLVPRLDCAAPDVEHLDGITVYRYGGSDAAGRVLASWRAIAGLIATHGPFDVVHSHFALHGLAPLWHPSLAGARRICQFQGPWAAESAIEGAGRASCLAKFALEKAAYARCDRFVVLSSGFKTLLDRDYGVSASKVTVIPAGIDVARFAPAADRQALRATLGYGAAPVVFVMRRLVRRMGLEVLLDAFAMARERLPGARLVIGGTGPIQAELVARAAALGLTDAIDWPGRLADEQLVALYQAADLTVVPTVALEGFGLVTIESLACGTPVLGTMEGGTAEILAPFDERLLVPPGRADALAGRLVDLLAVGGSRPDAVACRSYALAHYAWPRVLDRMEDVLAGGDGQG